jgi:hypothetical protein
MQFTTTLALLVASATASPLLGLNLGGIKVGVATSSALLDVKLGSGSSSAVKTSTATITAAPTAASTGHPTMPSSFSAPVQGHGILALDNLPALPAVIDKPLSGVLGAVYGLCKSISHLTANLTSVC